MKTTTGIILKTSLVLAVFNLIIGLVLKINNSVHLELLILTGAVISSVFITTALFEIYTSRYINQTQKMMLTAGFFCLYGIMPFIYLCSLRKNIVSLK